MFAKLMNFRRQMKMPNGIYSVQNIFTGKDEITGDIYVLFPQEHINKM